jgi:hypothetical protein
MFAVWLVLAGLAAALSLPILQWPVMIILAGTCIAMAIISASIALPQSHLDSAAKSLRLISVLAASVGIGIFAQIVPLPFSGLAQPLWSAMSDAIHQRATNSITVAPTVTVVALTKYLVCIGAALAAALLCSNRPRAAWMTIAIAWILTIFYAANLLKATFDPLRSAPGTEQFWADWISLAMLCILTRAAIVLRFETQHSPRRSTRKSLQPSKYLPPLAAGAALIAVFSFPIIAHGSRATVIPTVCGLSAFLTVVLIRRMALGAAGILFALALVVCSLWLVALFIGITGPYSSEVYGNRSPPDLAMAVRLLRDFRWFGSGAGTYYLLVPIYQGLDNGGPGFFIAPPIVLSILTELGIPLTLLVFALLLAIIWAIFSLVTRKDRDFSQTALACSSLVYIVAVACTPGATLSFSTAVAAAAIIGLRLAQAYSSDVSLAA